MAGIPSDSEQISKQDHELNYVLQKYGKRQTKENREKLSDALDAFRDDDDYTTYLRADFYKYVEAKDALSGLENS